MNKISRVFLFSIFFIIAFNAPVFYLKADFLDAFYKTLILELLILIPITTIVFYLVLTIMPGKLLDSACYIQYEFADFICINDFHILLFLLLIFSPILIHIISLQRLHRKCKSYDKRLNDLLSEQLPVKVESRKSNEIMELPS